MSYSNRTVARALLFSGMVVFIIGLNVAEELYPGYCVSMNYISDLGATCRGSDCHVFQPSSMIFNTSVFMAGLFAVIASYLIWLDLRTRLFPGLLALAGIGSMGVGLFPEYHIYLHYASASLAFVFGGIAAISALTVERSIMRYFSFLLGTMTIIAIIFQLVLSRIPEEVMFHVFLYGGGMGGASLEVFESGMHQAFLASFAVTLVAAVISALRPAHGFGGSGGYKVHHFWIFVFLRLFDGG